MSRLLFTAFESVAPAPVAPYSSPYARMMAALLPPGRLWRLIGWSLLSSLLEGCALEFDRLEARAMNLIAESTTTTVNEMLPECEDELGVDATGSTAERKARIVAHEIADQGYRPLDLQLALAPLLGLNPDDVPVLERSHAFAASTGDDREIFRFFVYRDPAEPGTYFLASAQTLVDAIKPSHTIGHVIESVNLLCDDAHSLCDRDLLGA